MKRLFLASVVPFVTDKLIEFLPKPPGELIVAFIPTAAGLEKEKHAWYIEEDKKKLKEAGFKVLDIELERKTEKQLRDEMKNIDIIFVAGGNTFYLLQEAKKSGFDKLAKELVDKGMVYVGSSAGAVLAGPNIEAVKTIDEPSKATELKSYEGLGLVDFVVLPHFGEEEFKKGYDEILPELDRMPYKFIKINDKQAVVVEGDKVRIIG
jgi:dipeptidase E